MSEEMFANQACGPVGVITDLVSCVKAEIIGGILNYQCAGPDFLLVMLTWISLVDLFGLPQNYLVLIFCFLCNLLKVTTL